MDWIIQSIIPWMIPSIIYRVMEGMLPGMVGRIEVC
jgi:hypothetical protein